MKDILTKAVNIGAAVSYITILVMAFMNYQNGLWSAYEPYRVGMWLVIVMVCAFIAKIIAGSIGTAVDDIFEKQKSPD